MASVLSLILHRLLVDIESKDGGSIETWFEPDFAKTVLLKIVSKVRDLYCCQSAVETLFSCFVMGNEFSRSLLEQLYKDASVVNTLLTGISAPNLHLPSYTIKTRSAVLKMY